MPPFSAVLEVFGTLGAVAILVIAARLDPDLRGHGTHTQLGLEPCQTLLRTGKPCFSCGLTTCYAAMMHARPALAWRANPSGIPLFLATLAMPFWLVHAGLTRRDPLRFLQHRAWRWLLPCLVVAVFAVWLWRVSD